MKFTEELGKYYGSCDPYKILNLDKKCDFDDIKKAYRKMALKEHPDRSEFPIEEANIRFQIISKLCFKMMDEDNRKIFDENGILDDEDVINDEHKDWTKYWNNVFPKINIEDIKNFEKTYRESEDELNDLKGAYLKHKGDMFRILEDVLCSSLDDYDRFSKILKNKIKSKELPNFPKFKKASITKLKRMKKRFKSEEEEAEKLAAELNVKDEQSLIQSIRNNKENGQRKFDAMIDSLALKYLKPSVKAGKKKK